MLAFANTRKVPQSHVLVKSSFEQFINYIISFKMRSAILFSSDGNDFHAFATVEEQNLDICSIFGILEFHTHM